MTKFRDKLTGEIIDVGNVQGEEAWKQLEFKKGPLKAASGEQQELKTFKLRDKQTGKTVSVKARTEDEAILVMQESNHKLPEKHYSMLEALMAAPGSAPKSAVDVASSTVNAFRHPVETAKTFKNLTLGILQMTGMKEGDEYVPYAQAAGDYLDKRYGSWQGVKDTLAKDPVGLLADLSVVLGGGSALGRAPGVVGKIGRIAGKAGREMSPASMAIRAAQLPGKAARTVLSDIPAGVAQSRLPQTLKTIAGQHPVAAKAAAALGGTPGKIAAGVVAGSHLPAAAGAIGSAAAGHFPLTALAVLGYSKAAQRLASKAANVTAKPSSAAYAAEKVKEKHVEALEEGRSSGSPTRVTVYKGQPGAGTAGGEPKAVRTERITRIAKPAEQAQPQYQGLVD